ncbi:hypothetical protein PAXRUDRAFT_180676 [Paxillus rubicundulus Ve08.2h10]|uniref:Uncharacterized protein n=1 Tax=Paxillus rubicundulus Ve08.2h10 TaxID=930991 RepID=A0A0D0CYG0_9AGAM|nr:hypothetical protein PAXRUDRAFT_180676 [Paxillus rubicundulus Ve08.2h10]
MQLWKARMTDQEIVSELQKHIDTNEYGIGLKKFMEICNSLGLHWTHQQKHTTESIHEAMMELQAMFLKAGTCKVVSLLFHEKQICIARNVVCQYFAIYKPELAWQHKASHLQHCRFWAAGVNDIWDVDQHDKFLCFGLALHTGIKPFSGHILWMKVWHSNCNPQLILSYYLSTVNDFRFNPLVTQSNPGTENSRIANAQIMLWQMHDPALALCP